MKKKLFLATESVYNEMIKTLTNNESYFQIHGNNSALSGMRLCLDYGDVRLNVKLV